MKYLLPLRHGRGIIQMHHRMGRSLHRLKGLFDDMFSGLGQYLNGHILRNHVPLDEFTQETVFRFRGRRKSHFDLLEAHLHQHPEKLQLLLQAHRLNQRLVPVPQINAAPDGRLLDDILFHPVVSDLWRHKIRSSILFTDFRIHGILSFCKNKAPL